MTLILTLSMILAAAATQEIAMEAIPVLRRDLSDDFPAAMLDKGFAILKVRVVNQSIESWELDVDEIRAFSKKGKPIERALSTDIAPEIVGFYGAGGGGGIHMQRRGYGVPRRGPYYGSPDQSSTIGVDAPAGKVPATLGQQLREQLESFEIQTGMIAPGQSVEGYFYLKSKESGNKLEGHLEHRSVKAGF